MVYEDKIITPLVSETEEPATPDESAEEVTEEGTDVE